MKISPAFLTTTMFGVVGLLITGYFAKHMFATEQIIPEESILEIPMALTDLAPGTLITESHLGIGRAREEDITRDTVIKDRVLIGRIVKEAIPAAEPIRTVALYPPHEGPPLQIAPGMRAVTVSADGASNGMTRLLKPGQYVDVHFTPANLPDYDQSGGLIMTLFKGVKILALDGLQSGSAQTGRSVDSVTLELSPAQANVILLAKDRGSLNLTFTPDGKGDGVIGISDENRATLDQILGLTRPGDPPRLDSKSAFVTETFSGNSRGMHSFVSGRRTDQFSIEQVDYNAQRNQSADPANAGTSQVED